MPLTLAIKRRAAKLIQCDMSHEKPWARVYFTSQQASRAASLLYDNLGGNGKGRAYRKDLALFRQYAKRSGQAWLDMERFFDSQAAELKRLRAQVRLLRTLTR